jgi:hypothetical protein
MMTFSNGNSRVEGGLSQRWGFKSPGLKCELVAGL